ncbi:DIS3-like exonuclease 2 [Caerostris extrusa]|uniref:DIS3-like exonuclease 2 n=1 Tax=Caerostris extrusa TaxID=172846 RepID=A0AAV4SHX9_CAEEX|nr:DIS3-like exonuclease 2 [Caerostris extrusa]
MCVARHIYETFPTLSLLRRHPPPQPKMLTDIVSMCETMGVILDPSSSSTLQSSIAQYKGDDYLSKARTELLMNLISKPMNCALYFCTGVLEEPSMFCHYALNVPLYTHFTSPIRRYPDIIVHRLLGASLKYNALPNLRPEEIENVQFIVMIKVQCQKG